MWNLKSDANKLICKTEADSQMRRAGLWMPGGGAGGWTGGLGSGGANSCTGVVESTARAAAAFPFSQCELFIRFWSITDE